jgi:hypothetical protein
MAQSRVQKVCSFKLIMNVACLTNYFQETGNCTSYSNGNTTVPYQFHGVLIDSVAFSASLKSQEQVNKDRNVRSSKVEGAMQLLKFFQKV